MCEIIDWKKNGGNTAKLDDARDRLFKQFVVIRGFKIRRNLAKRKINRIRKQIKEKIFRNS